MTSRTTRPRPRWLDISERTVWTLLQAGVGVSLVAALDLSEPWAVVIAGALAALKGELATRFGDGTAATLPAVSGSATTSEES